MANVGKLEIKRFQFSIGGYPGVHYHLDYKKRKFEYYTYPPEFNEGMNISIYPPTIQELEIDEVIVEVNSINEKLEIEEERIVRFYKYVNQYCKHCNDDKENV